MKLVAERLVAETPRITWKVHASTAVVLLALLDPILTVAQTPGERSGLAAGQPQAVSSNEARNTEIRRLMDLIRVRNMGEQVLTQMFELGIKPRLVENLRTAARNSGKNVPEELIRKVADVFSKKLFSRINFDDFVENIIPIYEKHFSEQEIQSAIQFYESPAGRHFIELQPQLMQEGGAAGQRWFAERVAPFIPEIMQETVSEIPEFQQNRAR